MIQIETEWTRVSQGDVYKNVEYIESVTEYEGVVTISKVQFPYVLVLTQDCELSQDRMFRHLEKSTQDKKLISILVAPLYNAEHVYDGDHLSELQMQMQKIDRKSTIAKTLRQNSSPRYHFLEFPDSIPIVPCIMDFKHYFSVPVDYLENIQTTNFICRIADLYREDISQRFASFLSRIGLPD